MTAPSRTSFRAALEAAPADRLAGSLATASARFMPETWDDETNSVEMVLNTGAWVDRWSWSKGRYKLRLSLEPGAFDVSRLNAGGPVLDSHNSDRLVDQIGAVMPGTVRLVADVGLVGRIRFSSRPEVAWIAQDVRDGILKSGSVGVVVNSTDVADTDGMEWHTATAWAAHEYSMTSIPADAGAQTMSAMAADPEKETEMAQQTETAAPVAPVEVDTAAFVAQGVALEAARQAGIRDAAGRLKLSGDDVAKLLADPSVSLDAARASLINLRAANDEKQAPTAPHVTMGTTEGEHFAASAVKGLSHRFGERVDLTGDEAAKRVVDRGIMRLAEDCLARSGRNTDSLSRQEIAKLALSTSDFPLITANSARKRLTAGYAAEETNYTPFCSRQDLPDFKTASVVKYGDSPSLLAIAEGGEYTHSTVSEAAETWSLTKYGRQIRMTWEMLINDDLGAFSREVFRFGGAAARLEMDTVWGIITGNPAMADGDALFHTNHGNITTSGADPSVPQIEGMQRLMRLQTGLDGAQLSLRMRHLLVPTALNLVTMQALGLVQGFQNTTKADAVPNGFAFNVIAEPRLDANSTDLYYGVADPSQAETIVYGYLQGEAGPVMESEAEFNTDGVAYKTRLVFGAKAIEHRSFVRNPGA